MIEDARQIPPGSTISADVCIIGAGAAGITIARELANSALEGVVLVGGGHRERRKTGTCTAARWLPIALTNLSKRTAGARGAALRHYGVEGASRSTRSTSNSGTTWLTAVGHCLTPTCCRTTGGQTSCAKLAPSNMKLPKPFPAGKAK